MTIQEILEYVGLASGGGFIGWLSGSRKIKAEGIDATIEVFEKTVKHLSEQVEILRAENLELRERVRQLEAKLYPVIEEINDK